jgi:poly(A) polymerase
VKPDSAAHIVQKLRQHGHEAYFVGGCVRDMVLGIEPADYDIATSARPEEVMRIFPRTEAVGAKFGVILVIDRGHPFEVATFRSDEAYLDGRRPTGVVFTNARQDVLRRDFTINGLLYDPVTKEIIDYISGQDDIRARIVRAIGDPNLRFEEDKLRVLRAVRFGARFGYSIEPETWKAVCEMAPAIHQVSKERIREELVRILTEGDPARGVRMLEESGLMREILPETDWNEHIDRSLRLMKKGIPADFATAVLLHETPADRIPGILERLKFSRNEMHHIIALRESLPKFDTIQEVSQSALKRFFRQPRFEDHLELARIHTVAGDGNLSGYDYAHLKYLSWSQDIIAPPPLISGQDLIEMGFRPGPIFTQILTRVEDEQLEGRLESRQQTLDFVRSHYGREIQP